jgi:hypothetical protein
MFHVPCPASRRRDVSGPEFFQTQLGRKFYEGQVPALIRNLKDIADALTSIAGGDFEENFRALVTTLAHIAFPSMHVAEQEDGELKWTPLQPIPEVLKNILAFRDFDADKAQLQTSDKERARMLALSNVLEFNGRDELSDLDGNADVKKPNHIGYDWRVIEDWLKEWKGEK